MDMHSALSDLLRCLPSHDDRFLEKNKHSRGLNGILYPTPVVVFTQVVYAFQHSLATFSVVVALPIEVRFFFSLDSPTWPRRNIDLLLYFLITLLANYIQVQEQKKPYPLDAHPDASIASIFIVKSFHLKSLWRSLFASRVFPDHL